MRDKRGEMVRILGEAALYWAGGCELDSPIEEMLMMALMFRPDQDGAPSPLLNESRHMSDDDWRSFEVLGVEPRASLGHINRWLMFLQEGAGRYRLDFAFYHPSGSKIAIECDGHDFHERTKEQAAHDKQRDRWLQSEGWIVLRFTGSEVYKDAHACVGEILGLMAKLEANATPSDQPVVQ